MATPLSPGQTSPPVYSMCHLSYPK
eukprot:UN28496